MLQVKSRVSIFLLVFALISPSSCALGEEWRNFQNFLARNIPLRPYGAVTGSEFVKIIFQTDKTQRERAILNELSQGNFPDFLRTLKPVHLRHKSKDGKTIKATIFAMPDYLGIGSNRDFIRIPLNLPTATEIAGKLGFILPTAKIVDALFKQSAFHLRPEPMPPGPQMGSTAAYLEHNQKIEKQRLALGCPLGALISGHKKDLVITKRLNSPKGRTAIYGWHRPSGDPIQPLCTTHGANYSDYSHGIRLIRDIALLNGEPKSIYEILEKPSLARVLSYEGAIPKARQIMAMGQIPPPSPPSEGEGQGEGGRVLQQRNPRW